MLCGVLVKSEHLLPICYIVRPLCVKPVIILAIMELDMFTTGCCLSLISACYPLFYMLTIAPDAIICQRRSRVQFFFFTFVGHVLSSRRPLN